MLGYMEKHSYHLLTGLRRINTMSHKHYVEMMQYALDASEHDKPWELWEYRYLGSSSEWSDMLECTNWANDREYRRKKQYIMINGLKVPKPVDRPLEIGQEYSIPYLGALNCRVFCSESRWEGDQVDHSRLELGLIHLTQEDASIHARALLSFTDRN
jgi:hypothetical protein